METNTTAGGDEKPRGRVFDVSEVAREVRKHLTMLRFTPRDADGTDFQRGDDTSLRFKVGTVRGEVTVQIWENNVDRRRPIRIFSQHRLAENLVQITSIVENHILEVGQ